MARAPSLCDAPYQVLSLRDQDREPVEVTAYESADPLRMVVPATEYMAEHPELDVDPVVVEIQRAGVELQRAWKERRAASVAPVRAQRLVRPRRRESHRTRAGHRRVASSRAGPDSDDGPAASAPPSRRRILVDDHYLVVAVFG